MKNLYWYNDVEEDKNFKIDDVGAFLLSVGHAAQYFENGTEHAMTTLVALTDAWKNPGEVFTAVVGGLKAYFKFVEE